MSPKIKLEINSKKSLEDLPNEKISISLNTKKANKQKNIDQLQIPNNKKSTEQKYKPNTKHKSKIKCTEATAELQKKK